MRGADLWLGDQNSWLHPGLKVWPVKLVQGCDSLLSSLFAIKQKQQNFLFLLPAAFAPVRAQSSCVPL